MSRMVGMWKTIANKYPVTRGMATYALLLPASNTTQQLLDPHRKKYNPRETLHFGVFGAFILAPTLYGWVRLANVIIKAETLRGAVLKAIIEQFTFAPVAYTQFYMCMNLMEGRSLQECIHQCQSKIPQTWKCRRLFELELVYPGVGGWSGMLASQASNLYLKVSGETPLMFLSFVGMQLNNLVALKVKLWCVRVLTL
ncbi:PXMP2/4 family protein 4 [Chionoecetes opilio]|uniref:PXMP2/4 family protein 4 n=1 Tax=Chionoecetes opilio TaxID=41210 RepID=A0A8J5CT19_CHIOP|nr:PXMP2/4 family protein 4 [Chionoecetes opilio]